MQKKSKDKITQTHNLFLAYLRRYCQIINPSLQTQPVIARQTTNAADIEVKVASTTEQSVKNPVGAQIVTTTILVAVFSALVVIILMVGVVKHLKNAMHRDEKTKHLVPTQCMYSFTSLLFMF